MHQFSPHDITLKVNSMRQRGGQSIRRQMRRERGRRQPRERHHRSVRQRRLVFETLLRRTTHARSSSRPSPALHRHRILRQGCRCVDPAHGRHR